MLLRDALKNLKYDRRLQEYNLDKGVLTKEELESEIGGLPDSGGQCEPLRFKEERRSAEPGPKPQYGDLGGSGHYGSSSGGGSSDPYGQSGGGQQGY